MTHFIKTVEDIPIVPTNTPATEAPLNGPPPAMVTPEKPKRMKHRTFFAATDTAIVEATKLLDQPNETFYVPNVPPHFAFKAVNPDTGLDAEYKVLRTCSQGDE